MHCLDFGLFSQSRKDFLLWFCKQMPRAPDLCIFWHPTPLGAEITANPLFFEDVLLQKPIENSLGKAHIFALAQPWFLNIFDSNMLGPVRRHGGVLLCLIRREKNSSFLTLLPFCAKVDVLRWKYIHHNTMWAGRLPGFAYNLKLANCPVKVRSWCQEHAVLDYE